MFVALNVVAFNGVAKKLGAKPAASSGMTLIELAVVIGIMTLLGGFAALSFFSMDETRDATMVESVQTSLQAVVTQASDRLEVAPASLNGANVINALNPPPGAQVSGGGAAYSLSINGSSRGASYSVANNGDVRISNLNGFTHYVVSNHGTIQKAN
ncbi:MAG: type II secretion system protein [Candidatus Melainabacteria bacterium]|nr:type II secretion system protein [Candidatus Melainabacteria bacterium]